MLSTFNLDKLDSLLKDFHTLTGIRITIFNDKFTELTSYPKEIAYICRYIRQNPQADNACKECDRNACLKASRLRKTYVYRCHAGLTEAVAPVYMGNLPVAYLMFGHIVSYPSADEACLKVLSSCEEYSLDNSTLESLLRSMPLTDEQTILAASRILMAVTSWLCLDQMITLKKKELPVQIDEYISDNLQNDLSTEALCYHFHIGKTKLYKLSKEYYGESIADHIRSLRIDMSKKLLLEEKHLSISEIAAKCGFIDYNYFITVFKKHCGVSPAKYRKNDGL